MNKFERILGFRSEARVHFKDGEFNVLSQGDYVRCAVTGVGIPLSALKYWSVEHQEAYASPEASMRKVLERKRGGRR